MSEELIGIIGGTGLGDALAEHLSGAEAHNVDTPFGRPSEPVMVGTFGERKIAFLNRHGPGHKFSPSEVPFAANIFALKKLSVHTIIASGAVGSLQDTIAPGDLVLAEQFIDETFRRQNTFFDGFAAVHCEMAEPVCGRLQKGLIASAEAIDVKTHPRGTYVCMEGPQFSTRAESVMHRTWGGDLIGMTAMPEAKLAREAQICYCLVALISDYDCWREQKGHANKRTLLEEIIHNLQKATGNCLKLIEAALKSNIELVDEDCRCRKSLELAVFSKPQQLDSQRKERLKVLFE